MAATHAHHRAYRLCLERRPGNVPGRRLHGLFDQADQAGSAAAGNPGAFHRRIAIPLAEGGVKEPSSPVLKSSIAEQVPAYLRNCRQNVIDMGDALDRVDFETVTILGHNMSGSGGMFGFQEITDIGAALQLAAESADNAASRKWVGELSSYLDRVETASD